MSKRLSYLSVLLILLLALVISVVPVLADEDGELEFEMLVSVDGGVTFEDANGAPGPALEPGADVYYKFVISNDGDEALTGLTLTDLELDTSACELPETLEAGESFECTVGPFPADEGQQVNSATVTALTAEETVEETDNVHYYGGEPPEVTTTIIIIEGPVEEIDGNIIFIFGINIEVDEDDPILAILQIGDVIRIEGDVLDSDGVLIILALDVIIINVELYLSDDGELWRDSGNCSGGPPPWAPAHGWRRRCGG